MSATTTTTPLHELLTIILTSSPAKCHPSTEMLEIVVGSFQAIGAERCRTIVMCDGYKRGAKHRPSRGIINDEAARDYDEYINRLRQASNTTTTTTTTDKSDLETSSPLSNIEVVVQPERLGFGFAVKRAVCDFVTTPYVMVVHHDQRYRRSFNLAGVIEQMELLDQVNYVGVLSPGTLGYVEKCKTNKNMPDPTSGIIPLANDMGNLVPLYVWFDRNHVGRTSFYRENVFQSGLIKKGTFIEDCYGQQMLTTIKANGLEAHAQYGCYYYDDLVPESMIHHIDGRRWMTPEQRQELGLPPLPDIMNK